MWYRKIIILLVIIGCFSGGLILAAPQNEGNVLRNITPEADDTYYNATTSKQWKESHSDEYCIDGVCIDAWSALFATTTYGNLWYLSSEDLIRPFSTSTTLGINVLGTSTLATTTFSFGSQFGNNGYLTVEDYSFSGLFSGSFPLVKFNSPNFSLDDSAGGYADTITVIETGNGEDNPAIQFLANDWYNTLNIGVIYYTTSTKTFLVAEATGNLVTLYVNGTTTARTAVFGDGTNTSQKIITVDEGTGDKPYIAYDPNSFGSDFNAWQWSKDSGNVALGVSALDGTAAIGSVSASTTQQAIIALVNSSDFTTNGSSWNFVKNQLGNDEITLSYFDYVTDLGRTPLNIDKVGNISMTTTTITGTIQATSTYYVPIVGTVYDSVLKTNYYYYDPVLSDNEMVGLFSEVKDVVTGLVSEGVGIWGKGERAGVVGRASSIGKGGIGVYGRGDTGGYFVSDVSDEYAVTASHIGYGAVQAIGSIYAYDPISVADAQEYSFTFYKRADLNADTNNLLVDTYVNNYLNNDQFTAASIGQLVYTDYIGTGSVGNLGGIYATIELANNAYVSTTKAINITTNNGIPGGSGGGDIGNAIGLDVNVNNGIAGGTISDYRAININNLTVDGGEITVSYAIYIAQQTGAVTNYGLYSGGNTVNYINYLGVATSTPWSGYNLAVGGDAIFNGGVTYKYRETVNDNTLTSSDYNIMASSSNSIWVKLPKRTAGTEYTITRGSFAHNVYVSATSSGGQIMGESYQTIFNQYDTLHLFTDGTNWFAK